MLNGIIFAVISSFIVQLWFKDYQLSLIISISMVLTMIVAGLFGIVVPALQLAMSAIIVLLMSGFILYDTSRIINGGETNYLMATTSLYLSIYNLFTSLLYILGVMSDD